MLQDEQNVQQLYQEQQQILQQQGTLKPLDPDAIARESSQAMAKAMGGIHQSQPDTCRRQWVDSPVTNGEEYDEDLDRLWVGGGAAAEARRQRYQQAEYHAGLPQQTYVPPETVADQKLQWEKAKSKQAKIDEDSDACGKESPDKAAGSLSTDQMLAEMQAIPKMQSS